MQKRLSIDFALDSVLIASIYKNMNDNSVYIGGPFGILDEKEKQFGFFDIGEINYMIKRVKKIEDSVLQ